MRFFELYGSKDIIEFNYKRCEHATDFNTARKTGKPTIPKPPPREATKQKLTRPLSGHVSFSPILPPDGKAAISFYHAAKAYCVTFSFEYFSGLHLYNRHFAMINIIYFDRQSKDKRYNPNLVFVELVHLAQKFGYRYSEYRAHVDYIDLVAEQFDFNGRSL